MEKGNKKKTLTISSDLKKKIDTSSVSTGGKKSFSVKKKKDVIKGNKGTQKTFHNSSSYKNTDFKKEFARKFIEQQATKDFIKKKKINQQEKEIKA